MHYYFALICYVFNLSFIVKEDVMDCVNQGAKRYERLGPC